MEFATLAGQLGEGSLLTGNSLFDVLRSGQKDSGVPPIVGVRSES